MSEIQADILTEMLERVYTRYNHRRYIGSDPLRFAYRFTTGETISSSTAVQVTASLARIEPADPVKYDFVRSRTGILKNCDGYCGTACEACELLDICSKREKWRS